MLHDTMNENYATMLRTATAYELWAANFQLSVGYEPTFASSVAPPVSLADYAARLACYNMNGTEAVMYGFVLLHRYHKLTRIPPTPLTMHRLLLAATVVASKSHYDHFYANAFMAKVGGVPAAELGLLELALLQDMDFAVRLNASDLCCVATCFLKASVNPTLDTSKCLLVTTPNG